MLAAKTSYHDATPLEALEALLLESKFVAGKWQPRPGSSADANCEPYGRHFMSFTPSHIRYYP